MRIGVLQALPGIGDMVWHIPAFRALAETAPDGKIILLARQSSQAKYLFAAEPMIAEIIALPDGRGPVKGIATFFKTLAALRAAKVDRIYILHHGARFRVAAKLAGIPERFAYPPKKPKPWMDAYQKSIAWLETLGIRPKNKLSSLGVTESAKQKVAARFAAYPRPWFVLGAGATQESRCWPAENFGTLVQKIQSEVGGSFFAIGTPKEKARLESIVASCGPQTNARVVADLPLDETLALLHKADAFIGNDSGPSNAAAAVGCPCFVFYALFARVPHSPLLHEIEPPAPEKNIAAITVDQVLNVLREKLFPTLTKPAPRNI
jgi:heptosyltransferase-2